MASENRGGGGYTQYSVPPPDRNELEANIKKVRTAMEDLQAELAKLNEKTSRDPAMDAVQTERRAVQQEMDEMRTQIDGLKKKQQLLRARIQEIDDAKKELRTKNNQISRDQPQTIAEIDAKIKKLELNLETSGMSSVRREKQVMQDIKNLEASKKFIRERESTMGSITTLDDERKELFEKVQGYQIDIETIRKDRDVAYAKLQKIAEKQNVEKDGMNVIRKEKDALRDRLQAQHLQIKKLRDQHNEDYEEWKKKRDEWKEQEKVKRENERKAREAKRAAYLEEKRIKDEARAAAAKEASRYKKMNPYEDNIACCDSLIALFTKDERDRKKAAERNAAVAKFNAQAAAPKPGMVPLKSKKDDDEWLFGDRTKKKQPKPKAPKPEKPAEPKEESAPAAPKQQQSNRKLPALTVSQLQAFGKVGIEAPRVASDVPETLEKLKEKKEHFSSFIKTMEQVLAEEAEEEKQLAEAREARDAAKAAAAAKEAEEATAEE